MNKYKTFEELKEEFGDKFEDYMYKANIELLNKLDKIKEKLKEDLKYGRSKDHLWLMGYYDACKDINKLLEEVE